VNSRSGIEKPSDLIGKRVGVPEYQMTASVWQRGILAEHYGVPTKSMQYFTGGLEQPGRREKLQLSLPEDISVTKIGSTDTLSDMLVNGEIDAVTCASVPSVFGKVDHIRRLFPDYPEVEKQYYGKTGIFPIMHVVAIKRELYDRHPWIASSLTTAFNASLERAYEDLEYRSALKTMLPWLPEHVDRTRAIMGTRYWSYGVEANRHTLETFLRYSYEQGLAKRRREVDELFAAVTDGARI
jgi:4,5-dihydroxyphthalate decarboxylase